jgi:hypothetical protein
MHSEIQALAFPKTLFNEKKIINWLYKYQYKPLKKVDKTQRPNFYRVRLTDPKKYKRYTTKILDDGVELILGWY